MHISIKFVHNLIVITFILTLILSSSGPWSWQYFDISYERIVNQNFARFSLSIHIFVNDKVRSIFKFILTKKKNHYRGKKYLLTFSAIFFYGYLAYASFPAIISVHVNVPLFFKFFLIRFYVNICFLQCWKYFHLARNTNIF